MDESTYLEFFERSKQSNTSDCKYTTNILMFSMYFIYLYNFYHR